MAQAKLNLTSLRGHHFLQGLLGRDSVVVDLGANLGEFSGLISSAVGCSCYAVEALAPLYRQIPESQLIKKFNYAVTGKNGSVQLNVSKNIEASSIYSAVAAAGGNMTSNAPPAVQALGDSTKVTGITLETFLRENDLTTIDLLKVDIEGAEIELFDSTGDEVLRRIKQITIEFHDFMPDLQSDYKERLELIKKRLTALGFFCIVFSPGTHMDVLFVNIELLKLNALNRLYLMFVKNNLYVRYNKRRFIPAYSYLKPIFKKGI